MCIVCYGCGGPTIVWHRFIAYLVCVCVYVCVTVFVFFFVFVFVFVLVCYGCGPGVIPNCGMTQLYCLSWSDTDWRDLACPPPISMTATDCKKIFLLLLYLYLLIFIFLTAPDSIAHLRYHWLQPAKRSFLFFSPFFLAAPDSSCDLVADWQYWVTNYYPVNWSPQAVRKMPKWLVSLFFFGGWGTETSRGHPVSGSLAEALPSLSFPHQCGSSYVTHLCIQTASLPYPVCSLNPKHCPSRGW